MPLARAGRRFAKDRGGVAAAVLLLGLLLVGPLAPLLAPYDAGETFLELITKPQRPFEASGHLLGTDVIGHDVLTQLLYGLRATIVSSIVCAGGAAVVGTALGAVAGYYILSAWLDPRSSVR